MFLKRNNLVLLAFGYKFVSKILGKVVNNTRTHVCLFFGHLEPTMFKNTLIKVNFIEIKRFVNPLLSTLKMTQTCQILHLTAPLHLLFWVVVTGTVCTTAAQTCNDKLQSCTSLTEASSVSREPREASQRHLKQTTRSLDQQSYNNKVVFQTPPALLQTHKTTYSKMESRCKTFSDCVSLLIRINAL